MRVFTRHILLGTLLLSALAVGAESNEKFKLIQVADLEALQKDTQHPVAIFDANDPEMAATIRQRCIMAMYRFIDRGQVVKEMRGLVRVWRLA